MILDGHSDIKITQFNLNVGISRHQTIQFNYDLGPYDRIIKRLPMHQDAS